MRLDSTFGFSGSDKDASRGEIASPARRSTLCGKTSLEDVIDLLALCKTAVSNDSGLMHIAAAVGTHVQAIYGSSSPGFTPPLTETRDIHYLDLECSPCFERVCPLGAPALPEGHRADDVIAKIRRRSPLLR